MAYLWCAAFPPLFTSAGLQDAVKGLQFTLLIQARLGSGARTHLATLAAAAGETQGLLVCMQNLTWELAEGEKARDVRIS